jgi:hypothetical protein
MSSGGALTNVAKTGDMTSLGPLESFVPSPAFSGNTVAFAATAGDGARGIFASTGGELTTIFKVGDPAPVGVFTSFFQESISMGADGKVTFLANGNVFISGATNTCLGRWTGERVHLRLHARKPS